LLPGQSVVITVTFRANNGARHGDSRAAAITATSLGQADGAKSDTVRVRGTKA
jgi:hypothetical protein